MAKDERIEETEFYTFVRSRRQVREAKARKLGQSLDQPLEAHTVDELQAMADDLDLPVRGSGSGGSVVKTDLLGALGTAGVRPPVTSPPPAAAKNTATAPPSGGKPKANTATT